MFNVRTIPPTTEIDERKVYNRNNVVITGNFHKRDAWALFELRGQKKWAISLTDLIEHDFEVYEAATKDGRIPSMPKALYSRLRGFAELNLLMKGL